MQKAKTSLIIPFDKAREKISTQIDKGNELLATKIENHDQLSQIRADCKIWWDFTHELLAQSFNTNQIADDFSVSLLGWLRGRPPDFSRGCE